MVGQSSSSIAEIVEVFRYQNVSAAKVRRNVPRPVNTRPLNGTAAGEVVNAIAKAILERSTFNIRNAVRPAGTGVNVVVPQRHNFLDTHRIHQVPAQISAWRVLRTKARNPIIGFCHSTNTWFADGKGAHAMEWIRSSSVIDGNSVGE